MPRWGQRAGTGGPHARHVGSGASERSGTVGTSRVRHAEPRGSAQRGRSVHATHVRETRPRGSRRACPSWGHTCHLEPRRSGRGVRVGTRGARVSRAFTRVTGVAHTCVTRTGLALPLGSRVSPPPPRQPGTSTGQRATPTRVTPGDTGHSKGSREATGRAPGGLQGTTRTDTRVRDLPSGSDQRRSHMGPSWGTSCLRSMVRIWSSVWMEGERPPCTQKICGDTRALSVREACTLSP